MGLKVEIADSNQNITPLKIEPGESATILTSNGNPTNHSLEIRRCQIPIGAEILVVGSIAGRVPDKISLTIIDGETHIFALTDLTVKDQNLTLGTPPFEIRITPDH